jgi:23S rRNA pseudouridine955/2504/2580 synthase
MKNVGVAFEDERCIVLDKPAGLAVQPGAGVKACLFALLEEEYRRPFFPVHRLDRDTSGLILVAKSREDAARFSALFSHKDTKAQRVVKEYLALTARGGALPRKGAIRERIEGREAVTQYVIINENDDYALFRLTLETGRMHQIRKHLAGAGHPILGDDKYGDFALNKKLRKENTLKRMLLHSNRLEIVDGNYTVAASAPLPDYWQPFIDCPPTP